MPTRATIALTPMADTPPQPAAAPRSSRRAWGGVLLFVLTLGVVAYVERAAPEPAGWGEDLVAGMARAAAEGKPLVVAFNLHGCPPCERMKRTTLVARPVVEALQGFVPVRLDVQHHQEAAIRYGVFAAPTYLVLGADGTVLSRAEGWMSEEAFLALLRRGKDAAVVSPDSRP